MLEKLQKISPTEEVKMDGTRSQSADKSWFYILGVYLGDGCVTKNYKKLVFRMNTIDMDFAIAVKSALDNLSDYSAKICTYPVKKSSKPNHGLLCSDYKLANRLVEETESKMKIPSYVFTASDENKKSFISGLMDSEGYVSKQKQGKWVHFMMGYKSCDKWVYDFIKIMQSVGIRIGKVSEEKPRFAWYKIPIQFAIKMQSWIESDCHFNIKRKEEKVNDWYKNYRRARLFSETTIQEPLVAAVI